MAPNPQGLCYHLTAGSFRSYIHGRASHTVCNPGGAATQRLVVLLTIYLSAS